MTRNATVNGAGSSTVTEGTSPFEQFLLDIIDTVREPLLVLDAGLRVTQANRAFFHTFHVAPDDTIGQALFTLGDGQWNIAALRELLRDRLTIEPALYDVDVEHVFPKIGRKIMQLNARLVDQGAGASRVILLAIEDVTERRITERRLAAQRVELERSNAALNEFAFIASHDLQEPLRKIVSFGERLSTTAGPLLAGNAEQYLERMLSAATRMRALINDLLSYSQVATGAQRFAATDLAAIMRDVVADLETTIGEAGGRVDVGGLPVIEADAPQMRQLFQNLLTNALKFRRAGVAPVVRVSAASAGNGQWTVAVADNGIGFKEEHGEKIFRMFERLNARTAYGGSGIGLAICRKIVDRHRGVIAATSTLGEGTTVRVTLPVTQADDGVLS